MLVSLENPGADKRRAPRNGIQSVEIAMGLVKAMAARGGPVALKDLSSACNMAPAKAHRYLHSLRATGLVVQSHRLGHYDLGRTAIHIGLAALGRNDVIGTASEALEDLASQFDVHALLSIWREGRPVAVRWQRGRTPLVANVGIGSTFPLLSTATGQIFLAYLPRWMTIDTLEHETRGQPEIDIDNLIVTIRAQGHVGECCRFIHNLHTLSVPILGADNNAEAAITIVGTEKDMLAPGGRALRTLKEHCRALSLTSAA